jgi:hypothetical protein
MIRRALQMVVLRGFYVVYCLKYRLIFCKIKNFRSKIEAATSLVIDATFFSRKLLTV